MKKGFTLIELLVVIAIIGILSAIVLASLNSARANSRDGKRLSDIAQLQLALESYFDACKQYPPANGSNYLDSNAKNSPDTCPSGVDFSTFIPSVPVYPPQGQPYVYELKTGSKDYCLGATLENANNSSKLTQCDFTAGNGTNNHRVKP